MLALLLLSLVVDPATYVGNVYGTVTRNGQPLANATVLVVDDGIVVCSATTAADGTYLINSIPTPFDGKKYSIEIGGVRVDHVTVLPGATMAMEVNADLAEQKATWRYRHEREYDVAPSPRIRADNFTRTIFATREGLVGGTTANGHIIVENDHFVALPSRRALSTNFGHEREVRITFGSRTAVMPVWDVGPWNTTDDYWNPASIRQSFNDLPRGLPESQAAFLQGYNGGKDGRGRTVLNPAGIDLADGTFRIDLALPTNSYIEVEYLWLDEQGPTAGILNATPNPTSVGTVSVRVDITDVSTGNSPLDAAEYFIDEVGPSGSGIPALPADGTFDSPSETIRADFVHGWTPGTTHAVYVHARDAYGNWGEFASTTVTAAAPGARRRATTH